MGPGSGPRTAKAITLVLVRDHSPLAVEVLRRMEPTDTEAVAPLAEAFATASAGDDWYMPQVIAEALARYGKAARPAAPAIIKALRKFRTSAAPGVVYGEQFAAYLAVLAGIGGDEPGVRRVVIDLLDPAGDVLKKTGPNAPEYQLHLLITLAKLGLPAEREDRSAALARVREGLGERSGSSVLRGRQGRHCRKTIAPQGGRAARAGAGASSLRTTSSGRRTCASSADCSRRSPLRSLPCPEWDCRPRRG